MSKEYVRNAINENAYRRALYNGIYDVIEHEFKYGFRDKRKELTYMVERYCREQVISGEFLIRKLEEYCHMAAQKYGEEKESE